MSEGLSCLCYEMTRNLPVRKRCSIEGDIMIDGFDGWGESASRSWLEAVGRRL